MAQYDIVFIKNDSVSGVSYNEYKLQKPPGAGYSLTQHPTTGVLSWVQSMNNLGTLTGTFDYNTLQTTGFYLVTAGATPLNAPKYNNGVLQVYKATDGAIYQTHYCYSGTLTNPYTFVRYYNPFTASWLDWFPVTTYYPPIQRPASDPRDPITFEGDGSISDSLQLVENALMDHTFEHVKTVTDIYIDYREWDYFSPDIYHYTIEIWGILPSDAVDVIPQIATLDAVRNAELYPEVYVGTNYITLQAKTIPADSFYVNVRIIKST